ncbi:DUF6850 family outer membrane beta-barrel protein [Sphingobacterium corticibacter]|nr:DUF6850 family outer membrane beta-barrel protein [Sphingobacterium corticibacter]
MKIYQILFFAMAVMALSKPAVAQQKIKQVSPNWLEIQDSLGSWRNTANPAGLTRDQPVQFSKVQATYDIEQGDFRRPQQAQKINSQSIYGAGNTQLNDYYLQGFIRYNRQFREDATYNASLIDPFRDMPYYIIDSNASDWLNQLYTMGFDLASPVFKDKWTAGLSVDYQAASGAKQRDIRAENTQFGLSIRPGLTYQINANHVAGFNLLFATSKEESVNSNVNVYVDQGYFIHYGLGHAIPYVGSGTNMNYESEKWGAGLQYEYHGLWNLLLSTNYAIAAETANIGFLAGRTQGSILTRQSESSLRATRENTLFAHQIVLNYAFKLGEGTEYWNEFVPGLESDGYINQHKAVRSTYRNSFGEAAYTLIKKREGGYDWKLRGQASYRKREDQYLLPQSAFGMSYLNYALSFDKMISSGNATYTLGGKIGNQHSLSGDYRYGGQRADELPVQELMRSDLNFLTTDFLSIEIPFTYSLQVDNKHIHNFYVQAVGSWLDARSTEYQNRKKITLSVGAIF